MEVYGKASILLCVCVCVWLPYDFFCNKNKKDNFGLNKKSKQIEIVY